jgi:hypothetical protein
MGEEFKKTVEKLIVLPKTRKFLGKAGDKLHN